MRTRNKGNKDQPSSNKTRGKRGSFFISMYNFDFLNVNVLETPEPKTPVKQGGSGSDKAGNANNGPGTPGKNKKGKNDKSDTPIKSRKRVQVIDYFILVLRNKVRNIKSNKNIF